MNAHVPFNSLSNSLQLYELKPTRLLCLWDFPSKNTRVGGHFLLQGIFPAQGFSPHLLHLRWQAGSLPLSQQGNPEYARILPLKLA